MSGRHGSVVFIANDDLDLVESELLELLAQERYAYGAMTRIPVARLAPGARGASVLLAEPPFDLSDLCRDGRPWLARLTERLGCSAVQLDASDYSIGLLETDDAGRHELSGWLRRWGSGEEPALAEPADGPPLSNPLAAPLRRLLRDPQAEYEARLRMALRLARWFTHEGFDPRNTEGFDADRDVVYVVRGSSALPAEARPTVPEKRRATKSKDAAPSRRRRVGRTR